MVLLILLNCSNSVLVRGVYIDAEEPAGQCVIFPVYYIRLFFQKERNKKQRRLLDSLEKQDQNNITLLEKPINNINVTTMRNKINNNTSSNLNNSHNNLEQEELLTKITIDVDNNENENTHHDDDCKLNSKMHENEMIH